MLNRIADKFSYLYLIISLNIGYLVTCFISVFSFLLKKKNPSHTLILFPYAQKGSDGYTRRFGEYFQFFQNDNIDYDVCDIFHNDYILAQLKGNRRQQYSLYRKIYWKRLRQVLKARHYKYCFVQRSVFPLYPDQKFPHLERLLHKLHNNITVDIWDAVWIYMPKLSPKVPHYAHKFSVVNSFLENYYGKYPNLKIYQFPIGVNLEKYRLKTDYEIGKEVRLFYTGSPYNFEEFLKITRQALLSVSKKYPLNLVYVSRAEVKVNELKSEFHPFSEETFFEILGSCDIGVYAFKETDEGKGKMAMKVLDYMAAGLPSVTTPVGLSPYARNEVDLLFALSEDDWVKNLERLINDQSLRKTLGQNARKVIEKNHSIEASYNNFRQIVFDPVHG